MDNKQGANIPPKSGQETKPELDLIGKEISGCVILEKISQGGMGTVFKAKHKALDRIVCVKILSPALAKDKKAVGLFLTEARAVAELDHQNIVQVYNVGKENGVYFIVMSFIEGEPLSHIVRKRPNLPMAFIVDTFMGVLKGLQAAHEKGIIHRDIKPSNILITKNLQPKIVDFGIAKKVDQEKGFTKTTELAGTAYFLSPEQASGKAIDIRADLYSVGASMFYVLTGKYPFTGKNSMEIIQKHINTPVPDMNQYRKGIPGWVVQAIQKLMAKNPDDRFQSAAAALAFFQKGRADEQLNSAKNINIDDEVGFTIRSNDMRESPRKNAEIVQSIQPALPSLDGVSGDNVVKSNAPKKEDIKMMPLDSATIGNTKTEEYIEGRKRELKKMSSITNNFIDPSGAFSLKKNSFLFRAFLNTVLATILLICGVLCFLKLGTICSPTLDGNSGFLNYFVLPWKVSPIPSGQIFWAIVCVCYVLILLLLSTTELLKKISVYALLLSVVAYLFGVSGFASFGTSINGLVAYSYLPVYAFLFVFMAIFIDDYDVLPLYYRLLTVFLLMCSLWALYKFFAPVEFASGEMITTLLYAIVFTIITLVVMPFMRDSFLIRMATMVMFVFAAISIWLYQGAGNAYAILNQMPKEEIEYQVNTSGLSDEATRLLEEQPILTWQVMRSYRDINNLNPAERRHVFIERLKKNYNQEDKEKFDSIIWNFALTEPISRFSYYYKIQNTFFFVLIMGVMYGLFMFIIRMLVHREEKWNLI